jgi:putative tryptophan/tyrosine transport system substrate-binding protein
MEYPMALQSTKTLPVIGFLNSGSASGFQQALAAFNQGLNESGYQDGVDVTIQGAWADGDYSRLQSLAEGLVKQQVAVIAASGGVTPAKAAKDATSAIPIVFVCGFNPADPRVGLVKSLDAPGGNATGINVFNTELLPQRLETFSQLVPNSEIVLLLNPGIFLAKTGIEQSKLPNTRVVNAATKSDLDARFAEAQKGGFAILVDADPFFTSERDFIIGLAQKYNVPTAYPWREYAEAGGLLSHGPSLTNPYRQIGVYAALVLNGANPATLPVIQSNIFELVINVGTAKGHGIEVPASLLLRADKIIH